MNEIRLAFMEFFGSFINPRNGQLIPAWQDGFQDPAVWPRITYEIVRTPFSATNNDFTIASASIWDRNTANIGFFAVVDDVLRQVAEKVSEEGTILQLGSAGAVQLHRSNPFIQYLDDPDDRAIMRGIFRLAIYGYVL